MGNGIGPQRLGSPLKQTAKDKNMKKATVNAARELLEGVDSMSMVNFTDDQVLKAAKVKNVYEEARSKAKRGQAKGGDNYSWDGNSK
jgi:hypothetical protein